MRTLVTGASGAIGSELVPALTRSGHRVVSFGRSAKRIRAAGVEGPIVEGDVLSGEGLKDALQGVDVAYYLVHSMEASETNESFAERDRRAAEQFASEAATAGVERIIYLGGPDTSAATSSGALSPHLASRLEVEQALIAAVPGSVAFRASIVIGARSRSFRFLVRLLERLPVMPLPSWREFRTRPIDQRDVTSFLLQAAVTPGVSGRSIDIAGPDEITLAEVMETIADEMLIDRPRLDINLAGRSLAAASVAAAVSGEDVGLIAPLLSSLSSDILPRDLGAADEFDVRLHSFRSAVSNALRGLEQLEPVGAR